MGFCVHPEGYVQLLVRIYGQPTTCGVHKHVKSSDFVLLRIDLLFCAVLVDFHILSQEWVPFKMSVRYMFLVNREWAAIPESIVSWWGTKEATAVCELPLQAY